jgi:hypothetical protein
MNTQQNALTTKNPYETPRLIIHGNLRALTRMNGTIGKEDNDHHHT